jgi:hypothetical protein
MKAYKIQIQPFSQGLTLETGVVRAGLGQGMFTPSLDPSRGIVVSGNFSNAQIKGIQDYVALILNGSDTSTVETAINALT